MEYVPLTPISSARCHLNLLDKVQRRPKRLIRYVLQLHPSPLVTMAAATTDEEKGQAVAEEHTRASPKGCSADCATQGTNA
ncbi:hypothetical protein E2C01_048657 [Portunus trituberculatus]|uniref:Uncharacterized protein n=1 Tax=Portunus trituberculatus TaxID=210409 RepID=A0A5B7G713_PORTR|nr:hypothetical protein [Portunus trituberculatus]